MRKVALFSTHCDTEEKIQVLIQNIRKVKSLGLDTIVLSTLILPDEVIELSTFVLYSKENPIPSLDRKSIFAWLITREGNKLLTYIYDYGFASLLQIRRLLELGVMLKYDYMFTMIYDIDIDENVERVLLENRRCSFFKNKRCTGSEIGGTLTAFDWHNAQKFSMLIDESAYYSTNTLAEDWMNLIRKILNGSVEDIYANDLIVSGGNGLRVNHSPFNEFSLFIAKDTGLKILFYDINDPSDIEVSTNLWTDSFHISKETLIEVSQETKNVEFLKIRYRGEELDLTENLKMMVNSRIEPKSISNE